MRVCMFVRLCVYLVGITVHQNVSIKDPEKPLANPIYELSSVLESAVSISNPKANSPIASSSKGRKGPSKNPRDYELAVSVHTSTAARGSLQNTRSENIARGPQPLSKPVCSTADEISEEYEYVSLDGKELFTCAPSKCK